MGREWYSSSVTYKLQESYESGKKYCVTFLLNLVYVMKLVRQIKMYSDETCNEVCMGKNLFDAFPIQNGLKYEDALLPLLLNFSFIEYAIRKA
jgi:hypothetical protein